MDTLYMFMGLCAWQRVYVSYKEMDFLYGLWATTKKEDYNLDKVFQVEKWIFLVDAACSLGVGMNRFPDVVENILLVVFGVTLAAHVYVFKSKKFRKENE